MSGGGLPPAPPLLQTPELQPPVNGRHNRGLMSARPDEALTRWLLRYTARVARFAAAHETLVDIAVAFLIAAASFVGLAIQGRLGQLDTVCSACCCARR